MLTCYKAALSVTEAPVPEIKIDYDIGGCKMKKDHQADLFRDPCGGRTNEARDSKSESSCAIT